jgi:serine/threonine protein kinase
MYTPLHYASEMGNTCVADVLVEKGADVTIRNNLGAKPGDICQNIDVRTIIEKHDGEEDLDYVVKDSLSKRSAFHTVILHNDRKSYVQRLMGRFQKVDKYLKEHVNGSEEALIQNIERQQKQREEEKKREKGMGMKSLAPEQDKKKKKKEGLYEKNRDRFVKIVQFEKKMKQELDSFSMEQDIAGPALFNPIGRLGRGSFGEVYLVEKLPEGLLYAMKILHKRKIMGQNLVRYARTERDVLSYFDHPFIVSIKYAFQTPEKLYMILEYCPGGDLGSVLKREKKLPEDRAKLYLTEIILALEALHKKDIIFRDLKPDNVVLDAEGHAMLTDFGLSKEGVNNNSSAKSFCGSVAYLAPEVLRRQGHGKSVDWYLVGVLLYEMLVGIPPYFSSNKDQMFKNIKSGPLRMPERLSKDTKDFIIKLLNKNPAKRLGAGKKDADELKEHAFFDGVNWTDVLARKQKMVKPVLKDTKKSTVNLADIVYGEYAGVGRVASAKEAEFQKALQLRGQSANYNPDADDLERNKIPGWSFIEQ